MASTIGIKIANGEFYSIVEENSQVKKRLILTTVHDRQLSVQIDLYKSYARTMADALYIGSLVVENIRPRPRGEPSIELVISSTKEGVITADAVDLDTSSRGEHQTLNVSLKSMDEDNREFEIPDFELEHDEAPPTGLYEKAESLRGEKEKRSFPWILVVCVALVLVAAGLALWLFVFRDGSAAGSNSARPPAVTGAPQTPRSAARTPPSPPQTPPAVQPPLPRESPPARTPPPPVIQAPAEPPLIVSVDRERRSPPVASYRVPSVIPRNGAPYRIRWGDTLWDIAEAFYRNPWLYPRIARFNNIRNPDLIISGTTIRVPPGN